MSILEPRPEYDADDPILDAVLGLYSFARRSREAIERAAPEKRAREKSREGPLDPLPEPIVALLLGIVSTTETLERIVTEASPPVAAASNPSAPSSPRSSKRGSLWR